MEKLCNQNSEISLVSEDPIVCHCFQVRESELVEAIQRHELQTVKEIRQCTSAGSGCNACHKIIRMILEEENQPSSASALPICSVK